MSDPLVPVGEGHTALTADDTVGLIPTSVSTRDQLNDAEERNISRALLRRPTGTAQLLDDKYLRDLHRAMFGDVWDWAGRYRLRETNIGVEPATISTAVRTLVADVRAWVDLTSYDPDEVAVRFHHRLVSIHPFPNGNGRHGRVAADYLIGSLGGQRFTWGAGLHLEISGLRAAYLTGLRMADIGQVQDLVHFARS